MSFQNALHEALVGLKGGDGWFSDKCFAVALRERGMSSVDAQDISRLCKNEALKTHNDLGSTTGFHTRRYDGARFYQIKDPGKDGAMSMAVTMALASIVLVPTVGAVCVLSGWCLFCHLCLPGAMVRWWR